MSTPKKKLEESIERYAKLVKASKEASKRVE
mgnify:CR=1 FL=1